MMFGLSLITKIAIGVLFLSVSLIGTYTYGYVKGSAKSEVEIANYRAKAEKQISDLKTKSNKTNEKVVTQYVDRVRTVRDKEYVYRDNLVNLEESQNELSVGWVELHDSSALMIDPNTDLIKNNSTSDITDKEALNVIISNYARCHENTEQLIALQKWISDTKQLIETENSRKTEE